MHPVAHRIVVCLLPAAMAATCLLPVPLRSQAPDTLRIGDHVRIATTDRPAFLTGTLTSLATDRLHVRSAGTDFTIRYAHIERLERRLCRWCKVGTASIVGAAVGLLALGGAGAVVASDQCDTGDCQELQAFAYWGIAGAQLGALMGLLIGGAASTERWAVVPVLGTSSVLELVEFAVQPGNAIRLHLSISK